MDFKKKSKGQGAMAMLPASAISVVFLVIVVALGVLVLAGMNSSTANVQAQTLIGQGITGLGTYGSWFNTIIIVIIAVCIISLLTGFFYARGNK